MAEPVIVAGPIACAWCGAVIERPRATKRFCKAKCRAQAWEQQRWEAHVLALAKTLRPASRFGASEKTEARG